MKAENLLKFGLLIVLTAFILSILLAKQADICRDKGERFSVRTKIGWQGCYYWDSGINHWKHIEEF